MKHLKLYPALLVCAYVPFFFSRGRRSIDCIQYLNSGSPIRLRTSNIHSAINMTLKWFTLSLKTHKAPWDGLLFVSVLILTVVLPEVHWGHSFQPTHCSGMHPSHPRITHKGKDCPFKPWIRKCRCRMRQSLKALGDRQVCFDFLVWCSFHCSQLCRMP